MSCWLLLLLVVATAETALCQLAQVILLRHAEKPLGHYDADLSERGRQRAQALVPFLS